MEKKAKILEYLKIVAPMLPAPIYWEDMNSVILGANEQVFKASGSLVPDAYINKTLYELYPKKMADHIKRHNDEVIRTGEILSQEEIIEDITTGKIKYFTAIKAPLKDDEGNIIGIIGTSIDVTDTKEKERLEVENKAHRLRLKTQEEFAKVVNQVAHDIRSPLSSLLMIVKSCTEIPEEERIALREAAITIGDIANNLLNKYRQKDINTNSISEERQSVFLSAQLWQLLTDKKYQYKDVPIKFDYNFTQESHFAFIKIELTALKRAISNLVNNAVDALEHKKGKIIFGLETTKEWVKISIEDNGKGMPSSVIDKIMGNISITADKKGGHGLGLMQVRETLQRNQGELIIDSHLGKGTKVNLIFPRIKAPHWIVEEIVLGKDDIIIILDDDMSIHRAWDTHFDAILENELDIQLKHFQEGDEVLRFVNSLTEIEKEKVFLLTDYELLKQELNGLNVIEKSGIRRSILVTSHYTSSSIHDYATRIGTRILPKQLASEIPIRIASIDEKNTYKDIELILVDDDQVFAKTLMNFAFSNRKVEYFQDPRHFLSIVASTEYSKETIICLDNNFAETGIKGIEVAHKLYELGYTHLYLLSGEFVDREQLPSFLTLIQKDDLKTIKEL